MQTFASAFLLTIIISFFMAKAQINRKKDVKYCLKNDSKNAVCLKHQKILHHIQYPKSIKK